MSPDFFIGWLGRVAAPLGRFLGLVVLAVVGGAGLLALGLGAAADDPAGPRYAQAGAPLPDLPMGEMGLQGVLTLAPYPVLHLADGRPVLLAEDGKRGAALDPTLAGRVISANGYLIQRGDIAMLVLGGPPTALDAPATPPRVEPLGRWRITGEICDGKCAGGGMRPGTGLGHRACAVLCLDGALPALFVSTAPVAGHAFFLLGDAKGGPLSPALRRLVGQRVMLEGQVERRGGLMVFLAADP